jgi:hypothetical protein
MDARGDTDRLDKSGNSKTALVLLSVALVFFLGVIASHILFG